MSWLVWAIANWEWILTVLLIIFIGIPFLVVMVIPMLLYLFAKKGWIPPLDWMIQHFKVDINQPPYSEWMNKHPLIFITFTSAELYTSYYLINMIIGVKWVLKKIAVGIYRLLKLFVKIQWEQYEKWWKEIEEEKKKEAK
jgi:hypothetical protein